MAAKDKLSGSLLLFCAFDWSCYTDNFNRLRTFFGTDMSAK